MKMRKIVLKLQLFSFFLIASLSALSCHDQNSDSGCSSTFYDFEIDEGFPEIVQWDYNTRKTDYNYKTVERSGVTLINEGTFATPLGYGQIFVIKDKQLIIEKYCPSCGARFKLESCAFSDCYYRIIGEKDSGMEVSSPWVKVEDYLHVFRSIRRIAKYNHLGFDVRRLDDPPPQRPSFFHK